jgi:NAD(P) transhydrogenase subunit beta
MIYGIVGMLCLIGGYWADSAYTYDHGVWLIAASMAPGMILGVWSGMVVEITGLPELVGAYNGFGGLAAALEGIGLYLGKFWSSPPRPLHCKASWEIPGETLQRI